MSTSAAVASSTASLDPRALAYIQKKAAKLPADEVFDTIRSSMGIIVDKTTDAVCKSGFFVAMQGKAYLVTTAKDLPDTQNIKVVHSSGTYEVRDPANLVAKKVNELQLKVFECYGQLSSQLTFLDFAPNSITPFKEGTKVYFGGYPLSLKNLAFHRGTISSGRHDEKVHTFTIDGTIIPGFSGGPVVMQHNGKVYLIGIIRSQIVSPSEDLSTHADQAIRELYQSVVSNRSTGLGKALDARHCYELIAWDDMPPSIAETIESLAGLSGEEFVGRKKGGIKTRILKGILAEYGYTKIDEGANHETWGKDDNRVSIVRGVTMDKYTAYGILQQLADWEGLDYQELKGELH